MNLITLSRQIETKPRDLGEMVTSTIPKIHTNSVQKQAVRGPQNQIYQFNGLSLDTSEMLTIPNPGTTAKIDP